MTDTPRLPHRVTVVGGGFGGLYAARSLGIDPERREILLAPGDLPVAVQLELPPAPPAGSP